MNPRELPEEPGLGKPLPRKEEKPPAKVDEWKPYGEKEKGLEQNTRTGELRTNRPTPTKTTFDDTLMQMRDYWTQGCDTPTPRQKLPSTSSPKEPILEAVKLLPSGKEMTVQLSHVVGASSALDAERYGDGRQSMQAQADKALAAGTLVSVYLDSSGNVHTAPVESTGADYSLALPAGSPKTNWLGTTTGRTGQGSGNSRDCLNWPVQAEMAERIQVKHLYENYSIPKKDVDLGDWIPEFYAAFSRKPQP